MQPRSLLTGILAKTLNWITPVLLQTQPNSLESRRTGQHRIDLDFRWATPRR